MKILTTDSKKITIVELRIWSNTNCRYTYNMFDELECDFPRMREHKEDGTIMCTQSELNELLDWWQAEVDGANDNPSYCGDVLQGRDYQEYPMPDGDEYCLNHYDYEVGDYYFANN